MDRLSCTSGVGFPIDFWPQPVFGRGLFQGACHLLSTAVVFLFLIIIWGRILVYPCASGDPCGRSYRSDFPTVQKWHWLCWCCTGDSDGGLSSVLCCQLTSCSPDPQGYCGLQYRSVAQCLNQTWDSWTREWISHSCIPPFPIHLPKLPSCLNHEKTLSGVLGLY